MNGNDEYEPLKKSLSISEETSMQFKVEPNCSKNSRKYQNRRFRPKMDSNSEEKKNTILSREGELLRNKKQI